MTIPLLKVMLVSSQIPNAVQELEGVYLPKDGLYSTEGNLLEQAWMDVGDIPCLDPGQDGRVEAVENNGNTFEILERIK